MHSVPSYLINIDKQMKLFSTYESHYSLVRFREMVTFHWYAINASQTFPSPFHGHFGILHIENSVSNREIKTVYGEKIFEINTWKSIMILIINRCEIRMANHFSTVNSKRLFILSQAKPMCSLCQPKPFDTEREWWRQEKNQDENFRTIII